MADNAHHLANLRKLREALVEKRRSMVASSIEIALANKEDRASTSWAKDIATTQDHIDAVDRCIADEVKLQGVKSSSMPLAI